MAPRGKEIPIKYKSAKGHEFTFARDFEGVVGNLERRYRETNSEYIRERISEYMSDKPCPTCKGQRLRPEAIAVTVSGVNIIEVTGWPVVKTLDWISEINGKKSPLTNRQKAIAERVIKEIKSRLGFLVDVGLGLFNIEIVRPVRFPAAKRNAFDLQPKSVHVWSVCCMSSTSLPSDYMHATTHAC